jgi:hypothetical protein
MIVGTGGLSNSRYNNEKQQKRNRQRSFLRAVNERWKTEYQGFLEDDSHINYDNIGQSPNNYRIWRDDGDSYNHSIKKSLFEVDFNKDGQSGNQFIRQSTWTAKFRDQKHVYHPKESAKQRSAKLFRIIERQPEKETTDRHKAENRQSTEKRVNIADQINNQAKSSVSFDKEVNVHSQSLNHDISDETSDIVKKDDTLKGILMKEKAK